VPSPAEKPAVSTEPRRIECPSCAELIPESAVRCRFCGEILDEEAAEEMGYRSRGGGDDPAQFIVPTNVSAWSLAAGYCGLFGLCLFPLAPLGVIFGVIALNRRKADGTYGSVTGDIRAVTGIVLGALGCLGWLALLVAFLTGAFD
jgi:hypothetical protein